MTTIYDYNDRPTSVQFAEQTTAYTYGPDGARQTKATSGLNYFTFYEGMGEVWNFGQGVREWFILQPLLTSGSRMRAGPMSRSAICTATT